VVTPGPARCRWTGQSPSVLWTSHLTFVRLVGSNPTIADLALYPYTTAASVVGVDLDRWGSVTGWLARVRELPGVVDDWVPYPANARPGAGRSIYD
jgi:glutathione S-transferase